MDWIGTIAIALFTGLESLDAIALYLQKEVKCSRI